MIENYDLRLRGFLGISADEEVAGMRITMYEACYEDLLGEGFDHLLDDIVFVEMQST